MNLEDHLSIGQMAQKLGVGVHVLRTWEKHIQQLKPKRINDRRYYDAKMQALIKSIYHLIYVQRVPIEQVQESLVQYDAPYLAKEIKSQIAEMQLIIKKVLDK